MSPDNLIWIDLEMTGLDSQADRIIEIATIVTDSQLNLLAEGPGAGDQSKRSGAGANGRLEPKAAR
jgi:oligoribonuclease (3'-5' exoribonuclease)